MIQKTLLQGVITIAAFVAIWFGLSQVDFMNLFKVEKVSSSTEEKLGDLLWKSIQETETIIRKDSVVDPVNRLVSHLADKNNIDRSDIKVHIVEKDEVNAFAMPGNHLIVYTGLIADCENESELAGVLGHEIAHMEKHHVMKKLVKEVGLSVLISTTTGGRGGKAVQETVRMLSSSAYDRSLESEADMASVEYLIKAKLDPEKFANFMYKMAMNQDVPDEMYWISTHPESEERAKDILDAIKHRTFTKKRFLTDKEWKALIKQVD
jgi:predicted Zn-dependent protease